MEPLRVLGIPISRPGYYMNCAMTIAQVELLAMDVSVTDYRETARQKGVKEDPLERLNNMSSADSGAVESAAERWREKYGDGQKVTLDLSAYGIGGKSETYSMDDLRHIENESNGIREHTAHQEEQPGGGDG